MIETAYIVEGKSFTLPARMFGTLENEQNVDLGIVENINDVKSTVKEYSDVYGYNGEIKYSFAKVCETEIAVEKERALANLFSALTGPINNVFSELLTNKN